MNENINLVEILRDCPKGTKLYSPLYGEVRFMGIDFEASINYPIKVLIENNTNSSFAADGKFLDYKNGKCLLFPSKEQRNWSKFNIPTKHKVFKPFEKVLVVEYEIDRKAWMAVYYSHWSNNLGVHITTTGGHYEDKEIIPYEGNENKVGEEVEE